MKIIIIKTQKEFDALPEMFEEYTRIEIRVAIRITINKAWGNSHVVARENSHVVARENSHVEAWENSNVVAWGNSHVVARENSHVVARENSHVEAWGNSHVVARENSHVEAWGQALVRVFSSAIKLALHGFSIISIPVSIDLKFKYEKTCLIQRYEIPKYLDREGVPIKRGAVVILFKKVSADFKTQEKTRNETLWNIGSVVTHPAWEPEKQECGEGKFHACSRPYFCDEFRSGNGDRYIAVKIKSDDLYEWPGDQQYPHKIAFRVGKVLYECDKYGRRKL